MIVSFSPKITILLVLSTTLIILTIISLELGFAKSSGISFLSFSQNFNHINNNNNSNTNSNSNVLNSSVNETKNWLTFSNNKFELKYPPDWKVEKKLSKFHVLDFKLIKNDPYAFIGISFSPLSKSEEFTNEMILEQSENFGNSLSFSGYEVYEVIEKNLTQYTIDDNPSSFHIVKYKYEENKIEGKNMEVFSIINKNLFTLTYQSTVENFDKDLSIVDRIINSVKILGQ
jgi:hypothetical protein